MKTKENCFKNFNDVKVILNKKTNFRVMCVRDFRASFPACKDLKINIKILKIFVILVISFFRVFRPFGLFSLCCVIIKQSFLPMVHLFFYLIRSSRLEMLGVLEVLYDKFHKIRRKTPVSESLTQETMAQLFSCEFCEIFNGTPPVAASVLYINNEINNLQYTKEPF